MNRNTTMVLAVVFVALLVVTLIARQAQQNKAAASTPTPEFASGQLWPIGADQIADVWLVDIANNRAVALRKDDQGIWKLTAPEARQADQAQAEAAASRFASLYASTTITTATDLTGFGVLSPTYTFGVGLTDGTELKASLGDKTPTGTSYYVLRAGEMNPVVVDSTSIEGLMALLTAPPYYVPTATPPPTVDPNATLIPASPTTP
jgi:hypothetical protein